MKKRVSLSIGCSLLMLYACGSGTSSGMDSLANEANENPKKDAMSQDCEQPNIKGVVNEQGEKLYYMEGDANYEKVQALDYFCAENYAKEAGYEKFQE